MFRLLSIEYFKLSNSKYFWILLGLFSLFMLAVPIGVKLFLDWMVWTGSEFLRSGLRSDELPFFDFVDIWQNLIWIYKSFSILLGFIVIISTSQEFSYGTIKQNIIDGLSPKEFIISKVAFVIALALSASALTLIIGLIAGTLWSPIFDRPSIMQHIDFIGAYFIHLVGFLLLCLVTTLLIKRSGLIMAFLIFYLYVIEPIITSVIHYSCELPWLAHAFPGRALSELIPFPLSKYLLMETQNYVGIPELIIVCSYILLYLFLANRLMTKRDLR